MSNLQNALHLVRALTQLSQLRTGGELISSYVWWLVISVIGELVNLVIPYTVLQRRTYFYSRRITALLRLCVMRRRSASVSNLCCLKHLNPTTVELSFTAQTRFNKPAIDRLKKRLLQSSYGSRKMRVLGVEQLRSLRRFG
jgi:hypothetical protein